MLTHMANIISIKGNADAIEAVCKAVNAVVPPTRIRTMVIAPCTIPQKLRNFLSGSILPPDVNMANTKVAESAAATKDAIINTIASGAVITYIGIWCNVTKRAVV